MAAAPLGVTNGIILNPKSAILCIPDVVLGVGEAMRRREFIILFGGAAAAWPLVARGQQPEQVRRIGVLMNRAANDPDGEARVVAFEQSLQQLGWTNGRNVRIDIRWGEDEADRERRFAAELVALTPDIILASGTLSVADGPCLNLIVSVAGSPADAEVGRLLAPLIDGCRLR